MSELLEIAWLLLMLLLCGGVWWQAAWRLWELDWKFHKLPWMLLFVSYIIFSTFEGLSVLSYMHILRDVPSWAIGSIQWYEYVGVGSICLGMYMRRKAWIDGPPEHISKPTLVAQNAFHNLEKASKNEHI